MERTNSQEAEFFRDFELNGHEIDPTNPLTPMSASGGQDNNESLGVPDDLSDFFENDWNGQPFGD